MNNQSKLKKWCDGQWLKYVLAVGFVAMVLIAVFSDVWSKEIIILVAMLPVLSLHMIEEGIFPGGFGLSHNLAMTKDPKLYDRYTLNALNDMFVNISVFILFLVLAIISIVKGQVPLGFRFPLILLCGLECIVHFATGVMVLKRFKAAGKKTIYTPGIISAYFCFLPLLICMIQTFKNVQLRAADWILGIILCVVMLILIFVPEKVPAMTTKIYDKYPYPDNGYFEKFLKKEE